MTRAALVALAGLALAGACSRKEEPAGLGPYVFGKTVKKNIHNGVCRPDKASDGRDITWCFGMPPVHVGKSKRLAEVDAYFLGTNDDAPLIEVQLKVRGCLEDETDAWVRERFGPPYETKGTREYWKNSFLWAAAFLTKEPGRCLLRFLPLSEANEIERIKLD